MVIAQEPAQSLAALDGPPTIEIRVPREEQDVILALMVALGMIMVDVFVERPPQGALAEEDNLGQTLFFHRPDPALRIGIQVRTVRRQRQRLNLA
jgi:hypothetical protein